ncbi:bifunctional diguanylate cyclase/phosphohydrolase [Alkalibacter saccharofermentans]|uniref:Diguanylate cyclase (GGDEF) domain-containing protein n=1 Tax=Alkalibacter saccharofermentans DSM 14828 TaxID=1120975 RepID=A0A1M4TCG2_9FIRM|nr:diguanylate cyclase [Alkalibacter saccharofermentans]SHE42229.1 diguanylate cyclase (GGDEF) domain-containing protein [Alkalibacter saccharofermentans DSM 14828]
MHLKKSYKKKTKVVIISILLLIYIISYPHVYDIITVLNGSALLALTLSLPLVDGYRGMIISILFNLVVAATSFFRILANPHTMYYGLMFTQISIIVASIIIGLLVENLNQKRADIETLTFKDVTTGLHNKKYMFKYLHELSEAADKSPIGILVFDVFPIAEINKIYGYQAGDSVLKSIADSINKSLSKGSIFCRASGSKFAIMLPRVDFDDMIRLEKEIHKKVDDFCFYDKKNGIQTKHIQISSGIAHYPHTVDSYNLLYSQAEKIITGNKLYENLHTNIYKNLFDNIENVTGSSLEKELAIKMVLSIIDSKDHYTYGHSTRVMNLMAAFGEALSLDSFEVERLKVLSLLHDIGKVDLPAELLNKTTKLTYEEFEIIKKHTALGHNILKSLPDFCEYALIVRAHHERFDGKGYPDGLAGNEIPYYSRMLSLADAFDAMMSNRPYRKGMELAAVIKEIEDNFGKQFDPELANRFIDLVSNTEKHVVDIKVYQNANSEQNGVKIKVSALFE